MKKTIIIGGAAGEGINTVQYYLEKLLKRHGFWILSYKNYMSRVRGGYNYSAITLSDNVVNSVEDQADIFIALNEEAVSSSKTLLKSSGILLSMDETLKHKLSGRNSFGMYAVGWTLKYFGVDREALLQINNAKWSEQVLADNRTSVETGYGDNNTEFTCALSDQNRILVNGNQAVGLGALSAGLGFYAAYPMAPSTGIMNFLATQEKKAQIIVEQVEDEIAAAMAAIGAASNGVRSMTGTSGGGFSLMVEALGFSAVAEIPLVICNVQRPGPATGLPTRTEQADLAFVVNASQGEFARIVLAPRSVADAFYTTFRAFNLAEMYQVPVIILTDQLLADSVESVDRFDTADLKVTRYLSTGYVDDYKRYDFSNVFGNRKYPGLDSETLIMTDSHVHDPYGAVTESEAYTILLKQKFLKKLEMAKMDLDAPVFYGQEAYETLFLSWGSTYGALKDAVDELNASGHKAAMLSFTDIYPLREDVLSDYVKPNVEIINVEGNAMNQFGKLLTMETGIRYHRSINRFDGRPFTAKWILEAYGGGRHE